jgi:hypothetical protein
MAIHRTIQERFDTFHTGHPHIYDKLVQYARRAKARGYKTCGIALLWEIIRYSENDPNDPNHNYKFANEYRSRYARLIMEREPDLAGFFKVHPLESA